MNKILELFSGLNQDLRAWCQGRGYRLRLLLLAYLAFAGFKQLRNPYYLSLFDALASAMHALGHVISRPFGEVISTAGGNIMQVAVPIIVGWLLLRWRNYFGLVVVGCWESFSLFNLATYIGDAQVKVFLLLNKSSNDTWHDWEYLLVKFGLLEQDANIAIVTRFIGLVVFLVSMGLGTWICYLMAQSEKNNQESQDDPQ